MDIKSKIIKEFKRDWTVSTCLLYHLVCLSVALYFLNVTHDKTMFLFACIFIASTYLSAQIWVAYAKIMDKLEEKK